jgi:Xaa-Pro aminopeptidase
VNWKFALGHIQSGGVRIEGTVLATNDESRNLTDAIPLDP